MALHEPLLPNLKLHSGNLATSVSPRIINQETALPEHLVRLPGTHWAMWRWIALRGAGFPANEVLKLAAPECAEAADAVLEAEAELEALREQVMEAIRSKLSCTPREASLIGALRRLKKGKSPKEIDGHAEFGPMLTAMHESVAQLEAKREEFRAGLKSATDQISKAMLDIANSDRFREAILWQNRTALHSGVDALLRMSTDTSARGSYRKRREELIANYLQRYCLKNDTIGFFGPVGWARFVTHGKALMANPGADVLAARRVYFEVWGMDVLAETLSSDERFRPWIVPRRMSFARLEGTTLHVWPKEPIELDEAQIDLFNSCDGKRTAKEIARQLVADKAGAFSDEAEVFKALRQFETWDVISWRLEARVGPYPEQSLREQLQHIGDAVLRAEAESKLAQLEAARLLVAQAAGNPQELDGALSNLEETFTALTGAAATRAAGRTYAGRTLVYEDCRRDVEVKVGPAAWTALGEPLSLLLESARWLTHAVAESYRQAFTKLFDAMTLESRVPEVGFNEFWSGSRRMLFDENESLVTPVASEFQRRWALVLDIAEDQRRIEYSSAALRARVEAAFPARNAGWLSARYHNPDVMIAAPDAEAVQRGDYLFVLGELHIGANALGVPLFMEQHESPEEFLEAFDRDMPEPRLMPLVPKYWPALTPRLMLTLATPRDYRLEMSPGPYDVPRARVLTSGQLVVARTANGRLTVRTRDGRLSFDIMEAFAGAISGEVANHFKPLPAAPHTPRVSFDRLVVCRETWRFAATDVWFAFEKEAGERFVEARRWAGLHELPRHLFVKAAVEVKPCYVDLASPVYVELFGKMIRRCVERGLGEADVVVTEMLPGPGESWLPDAAGERYSSELRMVALDLKGR